MVRLLTGVALVVTLLSMASCGDSKHGPNAHEHGRDEKRGPHGGRLLVDGDLSVELAVHEEGAPPRFRLYLSQHDTSVPVSDSVVSARLIRLGGVAEEIAFRSVGTFAESVQEIREPHSFEVYLAVTRGGSRHSWSFDSYEGRTTIPAAVAERAGIRVEDASARTLKTILPMRGKIVPSEHRIAHIIPRFPGMVREGRKHIGDKVEKGEILAIVESNQSLQPFEVRSQIAGTVINGHLIVGEYVPENQWVYVVADLSEVWADFHLPLAEREQVKLGQSVEVSTGSDSGALVGKVSYIAPYADERTQAQLVRVILPNGDGRFVPGMFVTGGVVLADEPVKVAVKKSAIQTFRGWRVVFGNVGDIYEVRPLTLGRADDQWVEVLSGLEAGERYVTDSSYTVKADVLKSGASHDH